MSNQDPGEAQRHPAGPSAKEDESLVSIRRAPKIGVFLAAGAALGVLAALILTSVFEVDPNVGFSATFGLLALYGVPIGMFITAVIAIVLDRISSRRAGTAIAGKLAVHAEHGEHGADTAAADERDADDTEGTAQG